MYFEPADGIHPSVSSGAAGTDCSHAPYAACPHLREGASRYADLSSLAASESPARTSLPLKLEPSIKHGKSFICNGFADAGRPFQARIFPSNRQTPLFASFCLSMAYAASILRVYSGPTTRRKHLGGIVFRLTGRIDHA